VIGIARAGVERVVVTLAALALAACAAFGPRIAPPTVSVDDVRLDRLEGANAWFAAGVTLANPNPRDITVEALDATLALEGEPVATFALAAPVTVAAHATAPATITARTGMDALLRGVANAMRRGVAAPTPVLRYQLTGTARLAGGLAVPFRREGEIGARPGRPT
jgi:hypothetical protein